MRAPVKPPFMRESTYWITYNSSAWRGGVYLPALHESVGITRARALAEFTGRAGVSYHAVADDRDLIYTVPRSRTAWSLRDGNPFSDNLCLGTPVRGYSRAEWLNEHMGMIDIAAWWFAMVSIHRQVDLLQCSHSNIRRALAGSRTDGGSIRHLDYTLATRDGTHTDPRGFPLDVMLEKAQRQAGYVDWETRGTPLPSPRPDPVPVRSRRLTEDSEMLLTTSADSSDWVSYFFKPGELASVTLGWGTAGRLHEAKWWMRRQGWQEPRGVAHISLEKWAHDGDQPHHMSLEWNVPPDADCLELHFTAPGQGLHIVGNPR